MHPSRLAPRCCLPGLLGLALACSPPSRPASEETERPQVVLHDVQLYRYEGTRLAALGEAKRAAFQRTSRAVLAAEARVRLPRAEAPEGQLGPAALGVEMRASEVEGSLVSLQGEARGGVRVHTAQGEEGRTSRAAFDGQARRVQGPEPVSVSGPGWRLDAQRFALDFAEGTYVFEGQVRTRVGGSE